MELREVGQGE
ncbi:uncharacterized, partial [Tachysurus ichikawai]